MTTQTLNKAPRCSNCLRRQDTPNYAYHVCVKEKVNSTMAEEMYAALSDAAYFDVCTQFTIGKNTAVILSAREYRKLAKMETPNTPIEDLAPVYTLTK